MPILRRQRTISVVTGKILEVADTLSLPSRHMNFYFQNRNYPSECVALKDRSLSDMTTWLPYVQEGALAIRYSPEESGIILQQFPHLPTAVRWLETSDMLVLEAGEWWPRLFIYDTLCKIVVQRFRDLDIGLHCYIIGANHLGRVAAAAMTTIGFSKLSLVDEDETKLAREVAFLKRYLLGVEIQGVPASTLTIQTKAGSMMLNALSLPDDSAVLKDLSYFNFMKRGGVVVDISECCDRNLLLEEAERADLKVLSGLEVQAQSDVDLLAKVFPDHYITYDDYLESFSDNLVQLKNSPSV
jgi:shikimate dehydrogenase